ncbi:Peptidyl-prolyl cis-trans isomerase [Hondaea fermentalgiana]|uniref:peptidylprolyl isomerase n=1 Tax=Hondaea fermentalgiana TaxID=2315210 RepID=A0A2R5GCJ8_9STRA|nr:Peptidyl-prolyl cis-trans isomerase [Hondaea fermentalgiana]|eukprot:GBG25881.1 Peptidyl-prolyl cis-trans isomerase [Hondaea fermentalgiana]
MPANDEMTTVVGLASSSPTAELHSESRELQDAEEVGEDEVLDAAESVPVTMVLHHHATGSKEAVQMEVYPNLAPLGAERFLKLVDAHFYDGACFFRVMKKFVAQVGIPANPEMSEGWGEFKDDPVRQSNTRGWISFAAKGQPNTRSFQFFFNYRDNHGLDSQRFAPFAKVIANMEGVDRIKEMKDGRGAPSQAQIQRLGNEYLLRKYPDLSCIEVMRRGEPDGVIGQESLTSSTTGSDPFGASSSVGVASPGFSRLGSSDEGSSSGSLVLFVFVLAVLFGTLGGCRRANSWRFARDLED